MQRNNSTWSCQFVPTQKITSLKVWVLLCHTKYRLYSFEVVKFRKSPLRDFELMVNRDWFIDTSVRRFPKDVDAGKHLVPIDVVKWVLSGYSSFVIFFDLSCLFNQCHQIDQLFIITQTKPNLAELGPAQLQLVKFQSSCTSASSRKVKSTRTTSEIINI